MDVKDIYNENYKTNERRHILKIEKCLILLCKKKQYFQNIHHNESNVQIQHNLFCLAASLT